MKKVPRILLVEDDDSIRESLCEFFTDEGYVHRAAADGIEAIDILKTGSFEPTLIILDLNMPRMSGNEFLCERAKLKLAPKCKIVMLSATSERPEILDVSEWIRKPIELKELVDAIQLHG